MSKNTEGKKVRLTMLKSTFGQLHMHRNNMRGLGLRRRHQTVELNATPAVMGMVKESEFMLKVEQV
jgi:large subunit ribosomal protein L30